MPTRSRAAHAHGLDAGRGEGREVPRGQPCPGRRAARRRGGRRFRARARTRRAPRARGSRRSRRRGRRRGPSTSSVSSTGTIASAPVGTGAPVMIRRAVPGMSDDRARVSCGDVAAHLQSDRHGADVGRAHRVAVHLRVAEQRKVDLRPHLGGGDPAERPVERHGLRGRLLGERFEHPCDDPGVVLDAAWRRGWVACHAFSIPRARSVPRDRRVDVAGPGVDPAGEHDSAAARPPPAAAARVSARMPWWQTMTSGSRGQPRRHPGRIGLDDAERHEQRAGKLDDVGLPRLAHVEQGVRLARDQPGVQLGGPTWCRSLRRTGRSRSAR